MTTISAITTWASLQTLTASALDAEFLNVYNTWNNHDAGTSTWTVVKSSLVKLADGTAPAPSLTMTSDTTMGLYRAGTNLLAFSVAGVINAQMDNTPTLQISDGSLGGPGLRFIADSDTGVYRGGANILGLVAGGAEYINVTGTSPFVYFVNMTTTTAAQTGTLTNSPVAGNPAAWMQVKVNGTNRYIPCW